MSSVTNEHVREIQLRGDERLATSPRWVIGAKRPDLDEETAPLRGRRAGGVTASGVFPS